MKLYRTDANQREIVSALHDAHMTVYNAASVGSGFPDLLVGGVMNCPYCQKKFKQNRLLEIKLATRRISEFYFE